MTPELRWRTLGVCRAAAALLLSAALAAGVGAEQGADLQGRVEAIIAPVAERAFVGVLVIAAGGEELCAINADRPFVPASNEKLQTSATALAVLGPEYRFRTAALAAGKVGRDGILAGDLVLRGGGDPVLATADLAALARRLRECGIRSVAGQLLADDTRFDSERLGSDWEWDDEPEYYAAQISALSVNRNVVAVTARPGPAVGAPVAVHVEPLSTYLAIDNGATTTARGSGGELTISRARGRNVLVLRGSMPLGSRGVTDAGVTVEDPTLYTALLFRKALAEAGVTVHGRTRRRATPPGANVLAEAPSPPLREILSRLNKQSDNMVAEMLLKGIAAERSGRGTAEAGLAEVRTLLAAAGVDTGRLQPRDGSGLSRHNLTTPRALCALLRYSRGQTWFPAFYDSLPVAGVDGTLRRRMTNSPARGIVRAKTGTLANTSALSGYVGTAGGEELVFSIMTNNFPGSTSRTGPVKTMEDRVADLLASLPR